MTQDYRSKSKIIFDVIKTLYENNRMIITKIGNYSNQSYDAVSNIINILKRANLISIEIHNKKTVYRLTTKGIEYYIKSIEINKLLPEILS
jgi:predicted transcriptional regulator